MTHPTNHENQGEWMINDDDPARVEISKKASNLKIKRDPNSASHSLGPIVLSDGKTVQAHVIHAVDSVITDGESVVMINRKNEPGKGKPALPGGFIDPTKGGVENAIKSAAREALEEAIKDESISLSVGYRIGMRNLFRPQDVRIASNDDLLQKYGVRKGDAFMISTQAVLFTVPHLNPKNLEAGDDALPRSSRLVPISKITREYVGISDHADMAHQAIAKYKANKDFSQKAVTTAFGKVAGRSFEKFVVIRQFPDDIRKTERLTNVIGEDENGDLQVRDLQGDDTVGFIQVGKSESAQKIDGHTYRSFSNMFHTSNNKGEAMVTDDEGGMGLMVELVQDAHLE